MKKTAELCMRCYYGAFNSKCCDAGCGDCPMFDVDDNDIHCKCTTIEEGEDCEYFVEM